MGRVVFDLARFVEGCFEALEADRSVEAIRDLLTVTVSKPNNLIEGLPDPLGQELVLFRDPQLTIIQVTVAPGLQYPPHNHGMEAAIGLYAGLERNLWFGPIGSDSILARGMSELRAKDSIKMTGGVIHAVANPAEGHSAGLHVYLGDLIVHDRTLWHPDTLQSLPFDNDKYFGLVREADTVRAPFPQPAAGPTPDR
jgi:predicted metal-dependent enzyme (double-stranded beta helix superfamily)